MMKIKFAVIQPEHIQKTQEYAEILHSAVQAGKMRIVDETTEKLMLLADPAHTCLFTEAYWNTIVHTIRSIHPHFKTDYILNTAILKTLSDSGVTAPFADAGHIITQALTVKGAVMQIPFDDEEF